MEAFYFFCWASLYRVALPIPMAASTLDRIFCDRTYANSRIIWDSSSDSSPNLPDKGELDIFSTQDEKSSKFISKLKDRLGFLFKDGYIFVKFYSILVHVRPF